MMNTAADLWSLDQANNRFEPQACLCRIVCARMIYPPIDGKPSDY